MLSSNSSGSCACIAVRAHNSQGFNITESPLEQQCHCPPSSLPPAPNWDLTQQSPRASHGGGPGDTRGPEPRCTAQPHTHSHAETAAQQRCWCSTHQGAGLRPCPAVPSPPLHSSAARGPSHTLRVRPQLPSTPGVLQTQNCGCPSTGWKTSTSCSLWPEGSRKHNRAMPNSDVIKTRLLPPPGHEVQSQQAPCSLFLRPIFGVSEHLGSN